MSRLHAALFAGALLSALAAGPALAATPAPSPLASAASPVPSPWLTVSPEPTDNPLKTGGGPDLPIGPYLLQLVVVTAIVAGAGYGVLRFVKAKGPALGLGVATRHGKTLQLVDRLALDAQRTAFVVQAGSRYFLLAATGDQIASVAELQASDVANEFGRIVEQERHRGESL